jgi:hypothetical protein
MRLFRRAADGCRNPAREWPTVVEGNCLGGSSEDTAVDVGAFSEDHDRLFPKTQIHALKQADATRPVPSSKIFRCRGTPNHPYIHGRLVPSEGRLAIVTNAGRDAVDATALGRVTWRRAGFMPVSDRTARGRPTRLRTMKSCGPDASTPASSLAAARSARPGADMPPFARRR